MLSTFLDAQNGQCPEQVAQCTQAKQELHEIWMTATQDEAYRAFDGFVATSRDKYPKAVVCLDKEQKQLPAFYDFPTAHWQHKWTPNPIELTSATVRLRTSKKSGCVSRRTILSLVYRLGLSAQKRWCRLRELKQLSEVIEGVKFVDGV